MSIPSYIMLLLVILCFYSCDIDQGTQDSNILATAYGEKLYLSELNDHLRNAQSHSDSQFIITRYVDTWLMDKILYKKATQQVESKKEISQKVESYKKSLYIYALENHIVDQELNTNISIDEIDTFYALHTKDFVLEEAISRMLYVKLPVEIDNDTFSSYWKTEDLPAMKTYLSKESVLPLLDDKAWYSRNHMESILPEKLLNKINFNKEETYSLDVGTTKYYVKILETIQANQNAPVSFVEKDIKERILHERTEKLIIQKRSDLFQDGINNKNITINITDE